MGREIKQLMPCPDGLYAYYAADDEPDGVFPKHVWALAVVIDIDDEDQEDDCDECIYPVVIVDGIYLDIEDGMTTNFLGIADINDVKQEGATNYWKEEIKDWRKNNSYDRHGCT
jgi:hypothetical protein